jgi:hypothetical protein
MTRFFCAAAALVAALSVGCSSGEGGAATPTAPTTTASTTTSGGGSSPTTQSCLPAAPGNLRVSVTDSMRVFSWDSVSNAQDYFIQIARTGTDEFIINTNTSQTTYNWTGAGPGNYWARVYARNTCGSGPNSNQVSFN